MALGGAYLQAYPLRYVIVTVYFGIKSKTHLLLAFNPHSILNLPSASLSVPTLHSYGYVF